MISAGLVSKLRSVLFIGAHSDDIEIGCGGTILRITGENPNLSIHWVVFSADHVRASEARRGADLFLGRARCSNIVLHNFRDGHFPFHGSTIKDEFERLKALCKPDVIFTHFGSDQHQDHRLLSMLAWNTWRDHLIMEYEVPKYDGDLGHPNVYVPIDRATCLKKARLLRKSFASQSTRQWFGEDAFMALLRLRGTECNSPTHYAEAFHCRKLVL
jgi:LmbE family N-acetylglucosaminyl deacetylase